MKATLEWVEHTYPNGGKFVVAQFGWRTIGSYQAIDEGFVVSGCRKVISSEDQVRIAVIKRAIRNSKATLSELEKIAALLAGEGVDG